MVLSWVPLMAGFEVTIEAESRGCRRCSSLGVRLPCGANALLVSCIYLDARRREMRYVLWTLLLALIPNAIGIVLYFVLRDALRVPCSDCGAALRPGFRVLSSLRRVAVGLLPKARMRGRIGLEPLRPLRQWASRQRVTLPTSRSRLKPRSSYSRCGNQTTSRSLLRAAFSTTLTLADNRRGLVNRRQAWPWMCGIGANA